MKKIYLIIRDFIRQLSRDNINAFASGTAFFFFLSLVPTLVIICSILPYTPLTEGDLITAITGVVPGFLETITVSLVKQIYVRSVSTLPVAILVLIWSSGKGMLALMRGLNVVNGVTESRNYFLLRIEASFYMVITVAAIFISLGVSVFGKILLHTVMRAFPQAVEVVSFLMNFRFLFVWGILTFVFTITYTYVPNKQLKMSYQIPGAVFSAIGWNLFSFFFSIYVDNFNGMSLYGSLSTIIIMMFWLYFCLYIFLIGANLNRYFKPIIRVLFKTILCKHFCIRLIIL